MSDPILSVEALTSGYGRSQVLFGMDFAVPTRGGLAILGRNGAGKTSLSKTLAGELEPGGGRLVFAGADCAGEGTERRVRRGLGYVPHEHAVFGTLTVRENPMLGAMAAGARSA